MAFIAAGILYSCDKDHLVENSDNSIIGKWKLKETLWDPGDGSGKWTVVSQNNSSIINIKDDGTLESTGDEMSDIKAYRIVDSVHVEFTRTDNSKISFRYKIQNSNMELNPPCIEACGLKYVKVEN